MTLTQLITALTELRDSGVPGETEVKIHQRSSDWLVVECRSVRLDPAYTPSQRPWVVLNAGAVLSGLAAEREHGHG